jgi:Golgi SNAP receptor complex protein 1
MSGTSWETTRKHVRALESRLDSKLSAYSAIAGQITTSNSGSLIRDGSTSPRNRDVMSLEEEGVGGYKLMEEEIDELLEKVSKACS